MLLHVSIFHAPLPKLIKRFWLTELSFSSDKFTFSPFDLDLDVEGGGSRIVLGFCTFCSIQNACVINKPVNFDFYTQIKYWLPFTNKYKTQLLDKNY